MASRFAVLLLAILFGNCGSEPVGPDNFPDNLSNFVPIDSVRLLPKGTEFTLRTDNGREVVNLKVKLVGVVDDFLPPIPMLMLEAVDPELVQLGGVAQGMSGSPVIWHGRTVGAISYTFTLQTNPPFYCFATPIEVMNQGIERKRIAAKPIGYRGYEFAPIITPLVGTGLNPRLLSKFGEQAGAGRFGPYTYTGPLSASGIAEGISATFMPGSPIGVALIVGDEVNIAGVGTVTHTEPDGRILAFGHPMLERGRVAYPIVGARILAQVSNLEAPFKFPTIGNQVFGAINYDRLPGISGQLGEKPDMIELETDFKAPHGRWTFHHQIPREGLNGGEQALLSMFGLFSPIFNRLDYDFNTSVQMKARISFSDYTGIVEQSGVYANVELGAGDMAGAAAMAYYLLYDQITSQSFQTLTPDTVRVRLEAMPGLLTGHIAKVEIPSAVQAGDTLRAAVMVRVGRDGEEKEFSLTLSVPADFPAGAYSLWVGPTAELTNIEQREPESLEELLARLQENYSSLSLRLFLLYSDEGSGNERAEQGIRSAPVETGLALDGFLDKEIRVEAGPTL